MVPLHRLELLLVLVGAALLYSVLDRRSIRDNIPSNHEDESEFAAPAAEEEIPLAVVVPAGDDIDKGVFPFSLVSVVVRWEEDPRDSPMNRRWGDSRSKDVVSGSRGANPNASNVTNPSCMQ